MLATGTRLELHETLPSSLTEREVRSAGVPHGSGYPDHPGHPDHPGPHRRWARLGGDRGSVLPVSGWTQQESSRDGKYGLWNTERERVDSLTCIYWVLYRYILDTHIYTFDGNIAALLTCFFDIEYLQLYICKSLDLFCFCFYLPLALAM